MLVNVKYSQKLKKENKSVLQFRENVEGNKSHKDFSVNPPVSVLVNKKH